VCPYGYTVEEVAAATLAERTFSEGLIHIRRETEQPQSSHYTSVVDTRYYEVVPIALHKVRVTPFRMNYSSS
jgi:hypothetical protein